MDTIRPGLAPELHGLRGVLALWVVSFHTSPGISLLTSAGYLAVDVFFIMSGLILMAVHGRDFETLSLSATVRFLVLRWARTYPMVLASCMAALGLSVGILGVWPSINEIASYLLTLTGWQSATVSVNVPIWSLRWEWLLYFSFPFLAWSFVHSPR